MAGGIKAAGGKPVDAGLDCARESVPVVRDFGLADYVPVWRRMMRFAALAGPQTREELWLLSHHPVFTLGQIGKREHLLDPGGIAVVQCDRGGQVTYHGPGQLVVYPLLDVRRRGMGIKQLVGLIELALVKTLDELGIAAATRPGAPGVYVAEAKIAALGLRIKRGWSYHGLSLNVDMDLAPFSRINPCGFRGLQVTQVADILDPQVGQSKLMKRVKTILVEQMLRQIEWFPMRPERNSAGVRAHA